MHGSCRGARTTRAHALYSDNPIGECDPALAPG